MRRRMSGVQIVGAGGRRNVRPCHMQQRTVQKNSMLVLLSPSIGCLGGAEVGCQTHDRKVNSRPGCYQVN